MLDNRPTCPYDVDMNTEGNQMYPTVNDVIATLFPHGPSALREQAERECRDFVEEHSEVAVFPPIDQPMPDHGPEAA